MIHNKSRTYAELMDQRDSLNGYRNLFNYPKNNTGDSLIYFCGNSLGLQPKAAFSQIKKEFSIWSNKGVLGQDSRWIPYHERMTKTSAKLVGAKETEVVVMNALTVNIHLLLISFYQPSKKRHKVIMEKDAFPSDQYAIKSQVELHGYDPKNSIIEISPRDKEKIIREKDIISSIIENRDELALIYIGGVNYYTGQVFNMEKISKVAKENNIIIGFNLAHAAGNIPLSLHDWEVDFSSWCTYKYLCGGPGSPAGIFIHENHHDWKGPRLTGWWGHNKKSRFEMPSSFDPIPTSEAWQISNAPIMGMAPLIVAMDMFDKVGMDKIREKSIQLTSYLQYLIECFLPSVKIITPDSRGCQLSIIVPNGRKIFNFLNQNDVVCDWRNPDVIRVAPHPLFNTYVEVYEFIQIMKKAIEQET